MKLYADCSSLEDIAKMSTENLVRGFTTNPSLLAASGVKDYASFIEHSLHYVKDDRTISFEVTADDPDSIYAQALRIVELTKGSNVYIKVPVMTSHGKPLYDTISSLALARVQVNATAVFTDDQVCNLMGALKNNVPSIISIFAGRIADTGVDAEDYVKQIVNQYQFAGSGTKFLWASCRESYNYCQASQADCDIITMTPSQIAKFKQHAFKDLERFSLETVRMFVADARSSGLTI